MSRLHRAVEGPAHPGYLLRRLSCAFRRSMDERLRKRHLPLSMAQMAALFALSEEPGATGAQLARRTLISAQAISTALRRLERDGFIGRAAHAESRRSECWMPTRKGRNALLRAQRAAAPVFARMLHGLSPAERRQFSAILQSCIASLESV
jgi:DNA-binding MarR family transcriptional regulator